MPDSLDGYGVVQHFNLDKALLVGGISVPRFGGGRRLRPVRLIVSGPVTGLPSAKTEPIVAEAIHQYLNTCIGANAGLIHVEPILRPSAPALRRVIGKQSIPLSNDTSFGVGYAPFSELESMVLSASSLLRGSHFHDAFPSAGFDFKVMGSRLEAHRRMTIALAFIDRHVVGVDEYFSLKRQVAAYLAERITPECEVVINTLDDPEAREESQIHLTVTGHSAEHGDDGEVGRGNRVNGLITPYRPMSLEAAAGKNPTAHVGKIYNVLASRLARCIVADVAGVDEAVVRLLSGIGRPIDQPQLVAISVVVEGGLSPSQERAIHELVSQQLASLPTMLMDLAMGHLSVF